MEKNNIAYIKIEKIPAINTMIRITSNGKKYIGRVFCNPYQWHGEIHFAIMIEEGAVKGATPVFVLGQCEIELEIESDKNDCGPLLGAVFVGQIG